MDGCGLDENTENREEKIENQKIQEPTGCRRYHARNKKGPVFEAGPFSLKASGKRLPVELESELDLARVGSGRGLACGTSGALRRIAELVNGNDVGTVEQVEDVGDKVHTKALAEVDALGDAHIELEKHGHVELVAA